LRAACSESPQAAVAKRAQAKSDRFRIEVP
jgi:hypothetical protein